MDRSASITHCNLFIDFDCGGQNGYAVQAQQGGFQQIPGAGGYPGQGGNYQGGGGGRGGGGY
jgi:hypothetical protein